MNDKTKAVAKSLHTVTVIVQVARAAALDHTGPNAPESRVDWAMRILDLAGRPDPYGLAAKALAMLSKGA